MGRFNTKVFVIKAAAMGMHTLIVLACLGFTLLGNGALAVT